MNKNQTMNVFVAIGFVVGYCVAVAGIILGSWFFSILGLVVLAASVTIGLGDVDDNN